VPTPDDDMLRSNIIAALGKAPCRRSASTHRPRSRRAPLRGSPERAAAARGRHGGAKRRGVKAVTDHIWIYPPPEEEFGGGDFVSLEEEPSTDDDQRSDQSYFGAAIPATTAIRRYVTRSRPDAPFAATRRAPCPAAWMWLVPAASSASRTSRSCNVVVCLNRLCMTCSPAWTQTVSDFARRFDGP